MTNVVGNKNSKIANIQFFLSVLIVFIHAGSTAINLPGLKTEYVFGTNISSIIQIYFSQGLCRVAVPLFLIISGYLFFKTFDGTSNDYLSKLKKRFFSLVIPYIFWSAAVFFAFYFAQKIPVLSPYFTTRNVDGLNLKILFEEVIINSYNSPLWFCRYLIVFTVFSILFYLLIKKAWFIILPIAFYGWFIGFPFSIGIRMDAVFFYLIGVFIALHKDKVLKISSCLKKIDFIFIGIFVCLLTINTHIHLQQNPPDIMSGNYNILSLYIQKLTIVIGCFAVWFGYDLIFKADTSVWKLSQYSFFVFVCHHPVVNTLKKLILKIVGISNWTSLITYFISGFLTLIIIISVAIIIKKISPRLYKFISGNR